MSWGGYRFELRLLQHSFNRLELARDNAAVLRVFGNVWTQMGASGALDI